jgi:hypothetical protein
MNIFSKLLIVGGVNETGGATPTRTARVSVSIGLKNGSPYFSGSGFYVQSGGGTQSGIVKDTGDVDISSLGSGNVSFTINLEDDVWAAGYRYPSVAHQAIAIVYYPSNSTTAPAAVFGSGSWPVEFTEPSISGDGKKLEFVDADNNDNAYEYSVALSKPGGGTIVLDPKIKNGGQN